MVRIGRAPSRRWSLAAALGGAIALGAPAAAPAARADRASAAEAMPVGSNPFLLITRSSSTSTAWDEAVRRPEYAVYPSGQFLVTKSDDRIYGALLSRDQTLDLLDFLMTDTNLQSLDLTYYLSSPLTTYTYYTITTRTGTHTVRTRASGGLGAGVKTAEQALARLDNRLNQMADLAEAPWAPGRLLVVSRPVVPETHMPVWSWDDRLPFAELAKATDVSRNAAGAIVEGDDMKIVREALNQSAAWKFGEKAAEFHFRPALPQEDALPAWRPAAALPMPSPPNPSPVPPIAPPPTPNPPPVPPIAPPPTPSPSAPPPSLPAPPVSAPSAPPPPVPGNPAPAPSPGPGPAGGASGWRDDDLDYAGIQKLFADLKRKTSGSPHGAFWTKSYEDFIAYEFDSTEGKARLLVPGDSAHSNLVKALEGKPLTVTSDGKPHEVEFPRMPPKGGPVPPADIERVRRWIDHGAPKERPAGAAAGTSSPPPSNPTPASPTPATPSAPAASIVSTVPLVIVGEGTVDLGAQAPSEAGDGPPRLFVATTAAAWTRLFDGVLPAKAGPNGAAIAQRLAAYKDAVRGYDFTASPLLLLIGPATDNYTLEVAPALDLLSDGSARVSVSHKHEDRKYVVAPSMIVRWAIYRANGKGCPGVVSLQDGYKTIAATNAE